MTYKRYQYYGPDEIRWTDWFPYTGEKEPWQIKGKLRNEYKEE